MSEFDFIDYNFEPTSTRITTKKSNRQHFLILKQLPQKLTMNTTVKKKQTFLTHMPPRFRRSIFTCMKKESKILSGHLEQPLTIFSKRSILNF